MQPQARPPVLSSVDFCVARLHRRVYGERSHTGPARMNGSSEGETDGGKKRKVFENEGGYFGAWAERIGGRTSYLEGMCATLISIDKLNMEIVGPHSRSWPEATPWSIF